MPFCAVVGCSHRSGRDRGVSFFRLPSIICYQGEKTEDLSRKRRERWLQNISREDLQEKSYVHTRVCGAHFRSGKPSALYDTASVDWAPTVSMGHSLMSDDFTDAESPKRTKMKRKRLKKGTTEANLLLEFHRSVCKDKKPDQPIIQPPPPPIYTSRSAQTDLTMKDIEKQEQELNVLRKEIDTRIWRHLQSHSLCHKTVSKKKKRNEHCC